VGHCLRTWFRTDTLGFPVLIFGLLARSLHISTRIAIVTSANCGYAGQGEEVFITCRAVNFVIKVGHMHCHML